MAPRGRDLRLGEAGLRRPLGLPGGGRDYPRAIFLAAGLIVAISILATLSIAFVVPQDQLSLVSGPLQAFDSFFQSLGIGTWATKVMAALTGLGTLALISTWLLGPAKGLYASEETGDLPPELHYVNKRHVPVAILVAQGALGSLFALVFLFVPSINTSYWMLSALTTQILVLKRVRDGRRVAGHPGQRSTRRSFRAVRVIPAA